MVKVGIISLGCSRNLVDSEVMLGSLKKSGFGIVDIKDGPEICIVNTCAFIGSAREESVDTILEMARLKKDGRIKKLIVCGCLGQLHKEKLASKLREADLVLGTSDFPKIADFIKSLGRRHERAAVSRRLNYLYDEDSPRLLLTPGHYAYVKISEGCSNLCSYCIISKLRGNFRSRAMESVIEETRRLSKSGILKEVNLVGQDTTAFGMDRYGKPSLDTLLRRLCRLKNSVRWIRVLYTHPAHYTDALIKTIREENKVCKYLDIPIQHISDKVLRRMNRRVTKSGIIKLIEKLRKDIPGIVLRTSIIVGFPGETDGEFKELLDFLRETRFEKLGAFLYSKEAGTKAARFKMQIPEKVKSARCDELMKLQQSISFDINRNFVGKTVDVLIDEKLEGDKGKFAGRTEGDAPEVDGVVYVSGKDLKIGSFRRVMITDALEYDLIGEVV